MNATDQMVISLGWSWQCLACGERNGTWQDPEMCQASADRHHAEECEVTS